MNERPLVSVVIPSYNSRRFIAEAIDSIRAQGVVDLEVVIVDDGSSDDSAQFIRQYAPEARLISQENTGPAAARNHGISEARGRYIAFLDADDIWLKGKLAAQLRVLESDTSIDICYGHFSSWHSDTLGNYQPRTDISPVSLDQTWSPDYLLQVALLFDALVWTPTVLVRADSALHLLKFNQQLDVGEDYDLWLRLSLQLRFVCLPVIVALYRDNPASITKQISRKNFERLIVEQGMIRLKQQAPRGLLKYLEPALQARLADLEYSHGRGCFFAKRRLDARDELRSLLRRQFSLSGWLMYQISRSSVSFRLSHRVLEWRRQRQQKASN